MSAPVYRTGVAVCARFATPTLRRACIAHRATVLDTYSSRERWRYQRNTHRTYIASVNDAPPISLDEAPNVDLPHESSIISHNKQNATSTVELHEPISRLDPYLPLELRSGTWLENLSAFHGVRNPTSLPSILLEIDPHYEQGVLTFLALEQKRWSAFLYLAEVIIQTVRASKPDVATSFVNSAIWGDVELPYPGALSSLGQSMYGKVNAVAETSPGERKIEDMMSIGSATPPSTIHGDAIGHLWQSLGQIVLKAADCEKDDAERMMSYVHRVLSTFHNEGQMHPMIYQFDSDQIPTIYRKSPFLHLMSSRIMTAISDSTWKAMEDNIIDNYTWMGAAYASSGGLELKDLYPAVRSIAPEAWLDLIMWSCVHGNHITAGANILRELASRQGDLKWCSISWTELLEDNLQNTDPSNARKLRDRFDKIAGAHEGYSKNPPIINLPRRTVSRESVVALIDNMAVPPSRLSSGPSMLDVKLFERLLEQPRPFLDTSFLNLVALRSVEFANHNPDTRPEFLDSVIDVLSLRATNSSESIQLGDSKETNMQDTDWSSLSAPTGILASLHNKMISTLVHMGDLNRALKAFLRLQVWLDERKQAAVGSFFSTSLSRLDVNGRGATRRALNKVSEQYASPLPASTLAAFLDLLTKHRLFDLATWLLSSEEPDGPVISSDVRMSTVFLPALLRFGRATSNFDIVLEVADLVEKDDGILTTEVFHAFIQAQMEFHNYGQVEQMLQTMGEFELDDISAEDVMVLASSIIRSGTRPSDGLVNVTSIAHRLLSDILQRRYVRDFTRDTQIKMSQFQELNQLSRILASIGGDMQRVAGGAIRRIGPVSLDSPVSADDFNILLEAVVDSYGASMGKQLFDKWCTLLTEGAEAKLYYHEDIPVIITGETASSLGKELPAVVNRNPSEESVVHPNKRTINIILDGVLREKEEVGSLSSSQNDTASISQPVRLSMDGETERDEPTLLEWCHMALKRLDSEIVK